MIGFEIGRAAARSWFASFVRSASTATSPAGFTSSTHLPSRQPPTEGRARRRRRVGAARVLVLPARSTSHRRMSRLFRRASDAEVGAVLEIFWGTGPATEAAQKARLRERLASIDALPDEPPLPFDETREDDVFPVLLDVGWELSAARPPRLRTPQGCDPVVCRFRGRALREEERDSTRRRAPRAACASAASSSSPPSTRPARCVPPVLWQQGYGNLSRLRGPWCPSRLEDHSRRRRIASRARLPCTAPGFT